MIFHLIGNLSHSCSIYSCNDYDDDRATASQKRLAELNPYVTVDTMTQTLDELDNLDFLNKYQAMFLVVHDKREWIIIVVIVCCVMWG